MWHPLLPRRVRETLADDDSGQVRAAVACRGGVSVRVLRRLGRDVDVEVREEVARNPHRHAATREALLRDRSAVVRAAAAHSAAITPRDMVELSRDPSVKVRTVVGWRTGSLAYFVLDTLAGDPSKDVRAAVAANEVASAALLVRLAEDPATHVRIGVAANPSTPPQTLTVLARDDSEWVRRAVAWNASAPGDLLVELHERGPNSSVRYALAANPSTPVWLLRSFATQDPSWLGYALAENPSTPADVVEQLATADSCRIRADVARHGSASLRVLAVLAGDRDPLVRRRAARALHARRNPQTVAAVDAATGRGWFVWCREAGWWLRAVSGSVWGSVWDRVRCHTPSR